MIPELGNFALVLAMLVALIQGILPLVGSQRGYASWIALARPAAFVLCLLVLVAFACLTASFIASDFSVLYVAQHSNTKLPLLYRIAAVWGGHEGSLLLWVQMLTLWGAAVAIFSRGLSADMLARAQSVLGLVAFGFLLFILALSNPFERLLPAAIEGRDLTPLLQDLGLIFHPPMLYMGYVGFSVVFSLAIAALLGGQLDAAWARWSRPWTIAAWAFLSGGIAMGSIWAYYELGWGGWWFWDPVENASFMPWLVGTALIHSLAVTEKRGSFKNWTVLLAIGAFSLSLLGTFLVRSGVLTSVHAFATDPERGIFILCFLAAVVGASLSLFAWRAPKVSPGGSFALLSRETLLLVNNVLLLVATGAVLLGTLYPLVLDALNLGKLSVGAPYFDTVFAPLMVPLLFLLAIGPMTRWKRSSLPDLLRRMRLPLALAIVIGALLPFFADTWSLPVAIGSALALWILLATLLMLQERLKTSKPPLAFWGMHLAHLGMAVTLIGVVTVKAYESEQDVRMAPGDSVKVAGYVVKFKGVSTVQGPNYQAAQGEMELIRNGQQLRLLTPEKRQYASSSMPMTEAAIDTGLTRDIYVSLGERLDGDDGAWSVRVYYKPFVAWIWGGVLLMVVGGVLAAADRRYRLKLKPARAAATGTGAGDK